MTDSVQAAADDFQATLDARSALIDNGGAQLDGKGNLRATAGWDAGEVIGKDGLDRTATGVTRLYYNAEGGTPWHRLGQGTEGAQNVEEALALAHMNGQIVKRPVFFGSDAESTMGGGVVHNQFATVYVDPDTLDETYLAVVGHRYRIIQPAEQAAFIDEMLGQAGGLKLETAGSLNGGRVMFMSLLIPENIVLDPEGRADIIKPYLSVRMTHDGTSRNRLYVSPVRPVCKNTLDWGMKHATGEIAIGHTSNALERIKEARQALGMTVAYYKEFEVEANELIQAELSNDAFERFLAEWHPLDQDAKDLEIRRVEARRDEAREIYYTSATTKNVRGTAWGALQALEEQLEHFAPVRPAKTLLEEVGGVKTLAEEITRSQRTVNGEDRGKKTELRERLLLRVRG